MSKAVFITGTGTDIGKTYLSGLIVKKLAQAGKNPAYYKAAMSGNDRRADGSLIPGDALFVKEMSGISQSLDDMCPYVYENAWSPHLASRVEGNPVDLDVVRRGFLKAPTDEALIYDIQKTKDFGFNMIRKHVKVEPARWYAHCDRIGIIVWQDMPNGDKMHEWNQRDYFTGADLTRTPQSEAIYFKEWKEIMDYLYSYPCIGVWVPFNEGWGQFKTEETANLTKQYDGTRLVNAASGGNHYTCGDMLDIHSYPGPEPFLYDARRANVIGEYGGIGYVVKGHVWEADRNWGYIRFNTSKEVTDEYVKYAQELKKLALKGFTGAVYTQTSDVEIEVNGLMTYDRKVIKVDEKRIREINLEICNSLK